MEPAPFGAGHVPVPAPGRSLLRDPHRRRPGGEGDLLSSDLELAVDAALKAAALLLERYGGPVRELATKSSRTDMVSAADRDAETLISSMIHSARPDDGLLGEEGGRAQASSGRRWVVDPLDGTTNFLYGFPSWAVSIALEDAQGSLLGVVFDPLREELWTAQRGQGAKLNAEPLRAQEHDDLGTALVATGFGYDPDRRARQAKVLERVLPRVRDIRRAGAASLDLCWLAAGRLDGYFERGLGAWDWAAARLVAEESGAGVADLDGDPHGLAAAAPGLLPKLLELLAEAEAGVFRA